MVLRGSDGFWCFYGEKLGYLFCFVRKRDKRGEKKEKIVWRNLGVISIHRSSWWLTNYSSLNANKNGQH